MSWWNGTGGWADYIKWKEEKRALEKEKETEALRAKAVQNHNEWVAKLNIAEDELPTVARPVKKRNRGRQYTRQVYYDEIVQAAPDPDPFVATHWTTGTLGNPGNPYNYQVTDNAGYQTVAVPAGAIQYPAGRVVNLANADYVFFGEPKRVKKRSRLPKWW